MKKQYFSPYNLLNYTYLDLVTKYEIKNLFLVPSLKQIHFEQKVCDVNSQLRNEQFGLNFLYFSLFSTIQPKFEFSALKKAKKTNTLMDGKIWKISISSKRLIDLIMFYKIMIIELFLLIKAENLGSLKQHGLSKKQRISFGLPYNIVPSYSGFFNVKDSFENNISQIKSKYQLSLILKKNKSLNFLMYNEFEKFFRTYFNS